MHPLIWEAEVSSRLVVPFASPVPGDSSYYVVHRKHDADRADVRAFVSWLVKEMAAFRAKHQRRD
jgi:DNA-binding transcriptional LysR family regulator